MNTNLNNVTTLAITTLALFIGACGDTGYGDTSEPMGTTATTTSPARATTVRATERTPEAEATPTTEPTRAMTPSATAERARATELTLVASSVRFDQRSLMAPAGLVTIVLDNRDEGVPHNLHVFAGGDASGADVGSTEIQAGAAQQMITLGDLSAGAYFYQCDVHPSQMKGTLTIS